MKKRTVSASKKKRAVVKKEPVVEPYREVAHQDCGGRIVPVFNGDQMRFCCVRCARLWLLKDIRVEVASDWVAVTDENSFTIMSKDAPLK